MDILPSSWGEDERRHLRARFDALYFHLYGAPAEAHDPKPHTHYLTKSLTLAYMNLLSANAPKTKAGL